MTARPGRAAARRAGPRALFLLLLLAPALGGCDKCADYFVVNPFSTKPAGTCPSGAAAPDAR